MRLIKLQSSWMWTPCSLINRYQHFGGIHCFYLEFGKIQCHVYCLGPFVFSSPKYLACLWSPPSRHWGEEWVELYLCSLYMPSWHGQGWLYLYLTTSCTLQMEVANTLIWNAGVCQENYMTSHSIRPVILVRLLCSQTSWTLMFSGYPYSDTCCILQSSRRCRSSSKGNERFWDWWESHY